jgi:hypothetical protein
VNVVTCALESSLKGAWDVVYGGVQRVALETSQKGKGWGMYLEPEGSALATESLGGLGEGWRSGES